MGSIGSQGYPLVFSVPNKQEVADDPTGQISVHTAVRALQGMQKEAVVRVGGGRIWRMVSDEGPYLNGTDLAPFPLAFFTAGLQFSLLSRLVQAARARSIKMRSVTLAQDNFYSMEGSFLRGDATGGAMPARVEIAIESDAGAAAVAGLVRSAERASGAHALMRDTLTNQFALSHNGRGCVVEGLATSGSDHTAPSFEGITPDLEHPQFDDIITKVGEAESVHGVEGGAGSSLKSEQKRTLHIHGEARVKQGMAMETEIRLFKPIGSSFRFLSDEVAAHGGAAGAPPPLAYVAAGVGFCYMTQLGRYAHILKKHLDSYSLIQENAFLLRDSAAADQARTAGPMATSVFIDSAENDEVAADFVRIGEKTCFLHAAMRGPHPSDVLLRLNGKEVAL
jgi:hypothetical protein